MRALNNLGVSSSILARPCRAGFREPRQPTTAALIAKPRQGVTTHVPYCLLKAKRRSDLHFRRFSLSYFSPYTQAIPRSLLRSGAASSDQLCFSGTIKWNLRPLGSQGAAFI